jgi:hypothetical protein
MPLADAMVIAASKLLDKKLFQWPKAMVIQYMIMVCSLLYLIFLSVHFLSQREFTRNNRDLAGVKEPAEPASVFDDDDEEPESPPTTRKKKGKKASGRPAEGQDFSSKLGAFIKSLYDDFGKEMKHNLAWKKYVLFYHLDIY